MEKSNRINVNIHNLSADFQFDIYKAQLSILEKELIKIQKELNLITDRYYLKDFSNCKAGRKNFCSFAGW